MKTLLLILSLLLLLSCNSKKSDSDLKDYFEKFSLEAKAELKETVTILTFKHQVDEIQIENILINYSQIYDKDTYYLIEGDYEGWIKSTLTFPNDILLSDFIIDEYQHSKVPVNLITGIVMDYKNLKLIEEMEYLQSRVSELESLFDN